MVTRPKDGQLSAPKNVVTENDDPQSEAGCPRQSFFVETRKGDDGDAGVHHRGALTPYRRKRSERRPESIMNNAG
jgi:hypothetical protein